jgi:tRNA/rRNA methyltransferase
MSQPAIVLIEPQLGDNIGAAARAMANCGLGELRLVNPRSGWPDERARATASGADEILDRARVYATMAEAIADLGLVLATTARSRGVAKPVLGAGAAAAKAHAKGEGVGVVFGRERIGLTNEEISLADEIVTFPIDPAFPSLNVAHAVLIFAYEWRLARVGGERAGLPFQPDMPPPAAKADLVRLFDHLEEALDAAGFFRPPENRTHMMLGLRAMLQRAGLTDQEVRTLRGALAALEGRPTRPRLLPDGSLTTRRSKP